MHEMTEEQPTVSLNWTTGASSAEDDEDELCCRICRQGEEAGKLYCPCRCAGSIKWIHGACLQAWLKSYERKPACELCGYPFDFIPVYSKNAPHQLTLADWVGAFCSSSWRVSHRVLRILYAFGLWGFLLPILTIMATRSIFGRRARPELTSAWHVLPLTLDIFIGECLSLAGIAFIYFLSFLTAVRTSVSTDARQEGNSPAADGEASPVEASSSAGSQVDTRQRPNETDPEEDLLVIMGLSGNPVRSFLSMLIFLSANVAGVYLFLGIPSFLGRWTLRNLLPYIQAMAPEVVAILLWSSSEAEASRSGREERLLLSGRSVVLPSAGANVLLDMLGLALGYGLAACCAIGFVLGMLLLGVALGYNSRSWQALRTLVNFAETQLGNFVSEGWWRFQRLTVAILQWVVFPAYVGHLVLCFLCGPVLHLSQHARASIMNSNPIISFVMQLFVGYVHLWGFAFMEGCIASVLVPEAIQRASVNFFVGAINCHRRLFGTMSEDAGATDSLPMPPHWATLKLALVHVAVHTPLVFTVWYLPAYLLDRLLGESLFPMLLVDHSGDVLEGLHRRDPLFLSSSMASVRSKSNSSVGEGQSLFVLELLQLYVLVLQCIRILETSPVMTKLISALLRCGLRFVGLGHFLVGESGIGLDRSKVDQATLKKRWMHWVTKRGKILGVASMLLLCCWSVMALVMALPLALGRLIVRCILSSQAKQISDFLPLSMGVVVASAWILVMVKLGEALPRILEQASALRRRRCLHIITCGLSAFGMVVAVLLVLPLGFGTLLLRLLLPLKVQSVLQVPIVFLVTDCWSVGLILTKVLWRLVQSDMIMHSLHQEIMAVWNEAQGSLTYIFFNLQSHWRIWRTSVLPMLEVIVFHLVFPLTAALTLLHFVGAGHEYFKSALLMYCYHVVLILRIMISALPRGRTWLREVRQQIFDSKYLISTELQNYHAADLDRAKEDSEAEVFRAAPEST